MPKASGTGQTPADSGNTRSPQPPVLPPLPDPAFRRAIELVNNMPFNNELKSRAASHGLDVVNVTWEDTGRNIGSSVGPNISDLTLQVREPVPGGTQTHLLPVLRYPNFSDTTADIAADQLWVKVGNQARGTKTVSVPLTEVLRNLNRYVSDPSAFGGNGNFLAGRDSHFLVSAQHVFMPLPKTGKAEFTPVLYNYQSSQGRPAVLNLLVTREGTSATVIENYDGDQSYQSWGQQLFFNNKGQRTTFTAERRSAVKARIDSGRATGADVGALDKGADMVLIVQIPLKVERPRVYDGESDGVLAAPSASASAGAAPAAKSASRAPANEPSDVETAVIGHGADKGPFRELNGLRIERDPTFPIRVTVQFYKATSNGVISDADLAEAKAQIDGVYSNGDYVGSLVLPDGYHSRPTEWTKARTRWPYVTK